MRKHLAKIVLFLIVLPIVSASSFTGTFSDYGKDTDGDGFFNYLAINTTVNINKAKNHTIYGLLKDSLGNSLEFSNCISLNPGTYTLSLSFNGKTIYRNKMDGPYVLSKLTLFSMKSCGDINDVVTEQSLTNAYTTKLYSYTQFQKGKPAIYCNNSPCTASSALIKSRDNINTPEPNAPNTIDSCGDGSYGTYLDSESIESITVTSLSNNFFKTGDVINVAAQVYCDSINDKLNFVYANNLNNIQWAVKGNKQCSSTGLKTLSTTFTLNNNTGQHAIRGVFGFNTQPNTVCGEDDPQHDWADNDDVVIYVKECTSNNDCIATECDYLDKCFGGKYRDYHDVQNTCNQDFTCTHNDCSSYTDNDDPECQGKYGIGLIKGWNLLSLPKIENSDINYIAANIFSNNFDKIATLKNNKWHIYDRSNLANSNLNELSESNGFWIKANDNSAIQISNESAESVTFNLTKGWNIIGYPSLKEKDVQELFQNVIGDIELVYVYNNHFESFNPQKPSSFIIKPGMGIFVKVKNNALWYFNGTYTKNKPQESFNLGLSEGWSLISIPLASGKTAGEIFGSNKLYYLENKKWKQLGGNNQLNYQYGYWIKTGESSLLIKGNKINNLDYGINQGWNLINYPLASEKSVNIFFQNVISNIESVEAFDNGEWKSFSPSKPNALNSLTILKPGKGIFVKAKNNAQWHFNGNELVAT